MSTQFRNRIEAFVRDRAIRLTNARGCEPKEIKVALRVATILPGETAIVSLRPTSRGRTIIRTSTKKMLRGVVEIRNAVRTASSKKRITIRLR